MIRSLDSLDDEPEIELQLEKVYKKGWAEARVLASESTSNNRVVPVSLARVKWLERDPDCEYQLVCDEIIEPQEKAPSIRLTGQRSNVKWNKDEDTILLAMMKQKIPKIEIAQKLSRTVKSIVGRLIRLGYKNGK